MAHRVADDLAALPGVRVHPRPRPLGSHLLGFPLLDRAGRRVAASLQGRDPVVLANGGNCRAGNATWLHYVHAAYAPEIAGRPLRRHRRGRRAPDGPAGRTGRRPAARVVIANSALTARHAVDLLGADPDRALLRPLRRRSGALPPSVARGAGGGTARAGVGGRPARWRFRRGAGGPAQGLRHALRRRGGPLRGRPGWDAPAGRRGHGRGTGGVAPPRGGGGAGGAHPLPRLPAATCGACCWPADALVSPTRYEAYGLAVQEALCCGLPAIVSAEAGVAERIPPSWAACCFPTRTTRRSWRAGCARGEDPSRRTALPPSPSRRNCGRARGTTWRSCMATIIEEGLA